MHDDELYALRDAGCAADVELRERERLRQLDESRKREELRQERERRQRPVTRPALQQPYRELARPALEQPRRDHYANARQRSRSDPYETELVNEEVQHAPPFGHRDMFQPQRRRPEYPEHGVRRRERVFDRDRY